MATACAVFQSCLSCWVRRRVSVCVDIGSELAELGVWESFVRASPRRRVSVPESEFFFRVAPSISVKLASLKPGANKNLLPTESFHLFTYIKRIRGPHGSNLNFQLGH